MRTRLPRDLSGREALRVLLKAGFRLVRQTASHVQLVKGQRKLSLPMHRTLGTGLLRALIRDAGMTPEEFVSFLS